VANLVLPQYLPNIWYEIYRRNIDTYIDHFGQSVRLLKRTETKYNLYSDIVKDVSIATTVKTIISKSPFESFFLSPPITYDNEADISGFFAYFKRDSLVRVDDIIIIEIKSIEGDVSLDAFEVVAIKGKRLEQEFIRRYMLSPFRDNSTSYEDASVLTNNEITHDSTVVDNVIQDPGGWSEEYYTTEEILPTPGTQGYTSPAKTLEVSTGPYEELTRETDIYDSGFPEDWVEETPYDIGKPLK
jgi:hypothetical protein